MEDDGVATEGLLIDEAPIDQGDVTTPHLDAIADGHKNKVIRTSPTPTQD